MATVNVTNGVYLKSPTRGGNTKLPYTADVTIDWAKTAALKGSALAAGDVIEAIAIPPETICLGAAVELLDEDNATTMTINIGTGVDSDQWAAGFDHAAAVKGAFSQFAADYRPLLVGNTADTVDVTLATLTGTLNTGRTRVFALLLDVSDALRPGIVQLGT